MASSQHVSVEIRVAQGLAGNTKSIRDKAFIKLSKWLRRKSSPEGGYSKDSFIKIWKGLHYSMWMQDKPLLQEELSTKIAHLIHMFAQPSQSLLFIKTFFITEAREWVGIDNLRMNKFMMMIREFFNQSLVFLSNQAWQRKFIQQFVSILYSCVLNPEVEDLPNGLKIHLTDIYLEEVANVGSGQLSKDQVMEFLQPYFRLIPVIKSTTLLQCVYTNIFHSILERAVNELMKSKEKEADPDEDEINPSQPEDLEYDYKKISQRLFEIGSKKNCSKNVRKLLFGLVKKFRNVIDDRIQIVDISSDVDEEIGEDVIEEAAERLYNWEIKLQKKIPMRRKPRVAKRKKVVTIGEELGESLLGENVAGGCTTSVVGKDGFVSDAEDQWSGKGGPMSLKNAATHGIAGKRKKKEKLFGVKKKRQKLKISRKEMTLVTKPCQKRFGGAETLQGVQNVAKAGDQNKKKVLRHKKMVREKCVVPSSEAENSITVRENCVKMELANRENTDDRPGKCQKRPKTAKAMKRMRKERKKANCFGEVVGGRQGNEKIVNLKGNKDRKNLNNKEKQKQDQRPGVENGEMLKTQLTKSDFLPSSFFKHAVSKVALASKKKGKKVKKMKNIDNSELPDPLSSVDKKRVSFNMKHNQTLDLNNSFDFSSETPFNPKRKPYQGILKPLLNFSPKMSHHHHHLAAMEESRPEAVDYF